MEAYYVMTYGAKSGPLPLLPPLFENNEAGGDFLAKEALDAVKDAEQKAAGILDTAAARCAAIRQDSGKGSRHVSGSPRSRRNRPATGNDRRS